MTIEAFRVQNFMGFEDSGWIELRPIALLFGCNSAGKSAILRALLLLQQSLDSTGESGPLLFVKDAGFDYGGYLELVRDHQARRKMAFWFQCRFVEEPDDSWRTWDALHELGVSGDVVKVRLTYGLLPGKSIVSLRAVDLYDQVGDIILQATAPEHDADKGMPWMFSSDFFDPANQPDPNLWPYVEMFVRFGFLPRIRSIEGGLALVDEDAPDSTLAFGETFHRIWVLLRGLRTTIGAFFQRLEYLSPLRAGPERFYYVSGRASGLARQGQNMVRNLVAAESTVIDSINGWLAESKFKIRLELKPLDYKKRLYELRLADMAGHVNKLFQVNIREVGFGISQALPIVVQTMLVPESSTVLVEQPELHLHPSLQAELGDLFIRAANSRRVRLLIETHSEHLLLRMRRRIAETTAGCVPPGNELTVDAVMAYFVDRLGGQSVCQAIRLDRLGDYDYTPGGFRDFFADDLLEILEIGKAVRQAESQRSVTRE